MKYLQSLHPPKMIGGLYRNLPNELSVVQNLFVFLAEKVDEIRFRDGTKIFIIENVSSTCNLAVIYIIVYNSTCTGVTSIDVIAIS